MIPFETVPVLEIGGTHVTAAVIDTGGWRVVGEPAHHALSPDAPADQIVDAVVSAAGHLAAASAPLWGVAVPGPFDYEHGIALHRGVGKFDALYGLDLGEVLRQRLTGPGSRVEFLNDANAFGIGEWAGGAAGGHDRVVAITLGTGVGSAFLHAGVPQTAGPGVPPDGELHLVDIDGRPLEDAVSSRAIRRRFAVATGRASAGSEERDGVAGPQVDVRQIAALARAGDEAAAKAISLAMVALGRVVGPRAASFGASVIVVGGSIARAWDLVQPAVASGMEQAVPGWGSSCVLVPAARPDAAALVGAAWHAVARTEAAAKVQMTDVGVDGTWRR